MLVALSSDWSTRLVATVVLVWYWLPAWQCRYNNFARVMPGMHSGHRKKNDRATSS